MVAWLLGCALIPNVPSVPAGAWADFVTAMTSMDRASRPNTHQDVLALIPREDVVSRVLLLGDHAGPGTLQKPRNSDTALEELVESALDEYVQRLVDSDDQITSRIAETNASQYYADEIEVLSAGPLDVASAQFPFAASVHFSDEQDPERMFFGDVITVSLHGQMAYDGTEWQIVECEVRNASIDDYSE